MGAPSGSNVAERPNAPRCARWRKPTAIERWARSWRPVELFSTMLDVWDHEARDLLMQRSRNLGRTDAPDQRYSRIPSPYQHLVTGVIGAELFPQRKGSRARSTCDRSTGSGGSRCRCRGVTGVPDQGRLNRRGPPGRNQGDGLDLLHEQRRCRNKDRTVVMQCQDTVNGAQDTIRPVQVCQCITPRRKLTDRHLVPTDSANRPNRPGTLSAFLTAPI
jgi:hypothetical protein